MWHTAGFALAAAIELLATGPRTRAERVSQNDDSHPPDEPGPARASDGERGDAPSSLQPLAAPGVDPAAPDYYHVPGEPVADESDLRDDFVWPEYIGETRERRPLVAVLLTLLSPGLGYAYMGRFLSGMLLNFLYPTALFALVVSWTLLRFYPLTPLAVLLGCLFVMHVLFVVDVLGLVRRERPYVLRPTNNLVVYASIFLFTFAIPIYGVVHWTFVGVWQRTWAGSDAMYPTVAHGDLVLVDRTAYRFRPPERGDLVLVEEPSSASGGIYFARVIGVGKDRVHMEGALPWVNGKQLGQLRHGRVEELDEHPAPTGASPLAPGLWAYVEAPYGIKLTEGAQEEPKRWYMVARPAYPVIEPTRPVHLSEHELFVLSDNRSIPFGRPEDRLGGRVIDRSWVVGRPLFVLYSVAPDDGAVRWDRMGLRLR